MKIPNDIHEHSMKIPNDMHENAMNKKIPKDILNEGPIPRSLGQATPRWLAKDVVRQVQMLHAVAQTQHRSAAVGARWAGVARVETHDLSVKMDEFLEGTIHGYMLHIWNLGKL